MAVHRSTVLSLAILCLALLAVQAVEPKAPALRAQVGSCPPARIYLPFLSRAQGLPPDPLYVAPPTPELSGPCPSATATAVDPTATVASATPERTPTGRPGSPTATATGPTQTPAASPSPSSTGNATATATPSPTISPTSTASATSTRTPSATPTPTPTRPPGVFGVQAFEADLQPIVDGRLDAAAATWVRTRALWAAIEPQDGGPSARRWGMSDSMITAITSRGLRPVVVVYTKPGWAASRSCGPVDRVPLARYGEFLQALVERYDGDGRDDAPGSPVARYWEIGNEPDLAISRSGGEDFGSCFGDDPAAYAEQLRVAWQAVKAADPGATVIVGGLAYERFYEQPAFEPEGPFRYDFLRQVLLSSHAAYGDEPGWPFFDWLGFHNYNDYRNNWDGPDGADPEIVGKAEHLRAEQMIEPGVFDLSDRPLFASEVGLPSGPGDTFTERAEDLQAAYAGQVMVRAMAAGLEGAIWYTFSDSVPDLEDPRCDDLYFWLVHGLMRTRWVSEALDRCPESPLPGYVADEDFEPKRAYRAFQVAAELLSGAQLDRRLSTVETGHAQIEAWRMRLFDGRQALVAYTDTGERIGRRGVAPIVAPLVLDASLLSSWTGRLQVTDHMGERRVESGSSVTLEIGQAPVFIEVLP